MVDNFIGLQGPPFDDDADAPEPRDERADRQDDYENRMHDNR